MIFPVPRLAEQRRIVACVDELMTRCDRLEVSLIAAADARRRLLETLLAEALAPAEAARLQGLRARAVPGTSDPASAGTPAGS